MMNRAAVGWYQSSLLFIIDSSLIHPFDYTLASKGVKQASLAGKCWRVNLKLGMMEVSIHCKEAEQAQRKCFNPLRLLCLSAQRRK
jgi:hypothetical protein